MISYLTPDKVFSGCNWCFSLNEMILQHVEDLPKRHVFDEVFLNIANSLQFQCINMMRFGERYVFIDCDDSSKNYVSSSKLKDLDFLYLKLQFDPNIKYAYPVSPFLYFPFDFEFYNYVGVYREMYKWRFEKKHRAWTHFNAISFERVRISYEMRRLGLSGGLYSTDEKNFKERVLDKESPRSRLDWNIYVNEMIDSNSIIDAPGYGDLTHRMIESLGIGIPLIRPRLKNSMISKLEEGIHYLDCGQSGENLEKCILLLEDKKIREQLINNEIEWFDENIRPDKAQHHFFNILGKYIETCH